MDDKVLAHKAMLLLECGEYIELDGNAIIMDYPRNGVWIGVSKFVRDWRIAGPLIERVISERGWDGVQPGPEVGDSVPRDIVEHCVEVLTTVHDGLTPKETE